MKRALLALAAASLLIAAAPEAELEHVVKPGETLLIIALRAKVPQVLIAEANGLKPPYAVHAGQHLLIPRTRHHTVMRGESTFTIAYTYAVPWRDIAVANGLDPKAEVHVGQKLLIPTKVGRPVSPPLAEETASAPHFAWPLTAPVARGFVARGRRDYHDGLDLKAAEGTAVRAAAAGTVLYAGEEPRQFGKLVVIDHGQGWHSAYAFLSRVTVSKGDPVRAGELVGLVGHSGMAQGNQLHFELRHDNRPVDPARLLPDAPTKAPRTPSR